MMILKLMILIMILIITVMMKNAKQEYYRLTS